MENNTSNNPIQSGERLCQYHVLFCKYENPRNWISIQIVDMSFVCIKKSAEYKMLGVYN